MSNLLHWGDRLNSLPLVWMAIATVSIFLTRLLTIWFYTQRLLKKVGGASVEKVVEVLKTSLASGRPVVPTMVSSLYFLCGCGLIIVTLWGLVSTAWWFLPLGGLCWYLAHRPFREVMESWAQTQRLAMISEDAAILLKGGLTTEQQKTIKKRMGLK